MKKPDKKSGHKENPTKKGSRAFGTSGKSRGGAPEPTNDAPAGSSTEVPAGGNPHFSDSPDATEKQGKTLYLKLDGDGNPLWSRMTPATIETWETIFRHPSTGAQFNAQPLPPDSTGANANDGEMLIGWLAMGQAMMFARMTKLPLDAAAEICAYAGEEKANLAARLARLLNKHGGDWMAKYGDEIFFASALGMGMARRFQACREEAAKRGAVDARVVVPGAEKPAPAAVASDEAERVQ